MHSSLHFFLSLLVAISAPVLAWNSSCELGAQQRQGGVGRGSRRLVRQLDDADKEKAAEARAILRAKGAAIIPILLDECHRSMERASQSHLLNESGELESSDDEFSLQGAIASLLQDIGVDAVPPLRAILTTGDSCRHVALWAFRGMGTTAQTATPEVLATLTDPDPVVRRAALDLVAAWCPEVDDGILARLLVDDDVLVRNKAVSVTARCGIPSASVGLLIEILLDDAEHVWTRSAAARALAPLAAEREDARDALDEASHDDNTYVRGAAERALSGTTAKREE